MDPMCTRVIEKQKKTVGHHPREVFVSKQVNEQKKLDPLPWFANQRAIEWIDVWAGRHEGGVRA
jgi:hypothetical protein